MEFDVDATRTRLQAQTATDVAPGDVPAVVRVPEEELAGLPGFEHPPHYRELDGVRLAHVDVGEGRPVVFLHGDPAWSYLWRHVIPPVRDAGHRCVAPDLAGFGRSDKPTDLGWYTFDRHCAHVAALLEDLDLREATLVVHDWGGSIGLRVAVEQADRVDRLVVMDTDLHTGEAPKSEAWHAFRQFVEDNEDLPIGGLMRAGCHAEPADEVISAYERPFPIPAAKAGARAFPLIHPTAYDDPDAVLMRGVRDALRADERPMLILWGEADPILTLEAGRALAADVGRPPPRPVPEAGHFLQEDRGAEVGALIAEWLKETA